MPQFQGSESLLLAVGILGATVMPHVIYLHSALMQNRIVPRNEQEARRLYRFTRIDVVIAMSIAGRRSTWRCSSSPRTSSSARAC